MNIETHSTNSSNALLGKKPAAYRVWIIDDDAAILDLLGAFYTGVGNEVTSFADPLAFYERFKTTFNDPRPPCDLILCDLQMPNMNGLECLSKIRESKYSIPVIFITGQGSVDTAVEALAGGASDYIVKPIHLPELEVVSDRAVAISQMQRSYAALQTAVSQQKSMGALVGRSSSMQKVFDMIRRISGSGCNQILVTGESGTGKELVSRAIHSHSSRATKPFVAVNCAAIPESLLESELFGHAKGSFTGASARRVGLFEEANGGTLLLDEIGDLSLALQVKLLRVLQEKTVRAVGDNEHRDIDVRVIAATHKNLMQAVKDGSFREDLYYRLAVVHIDIPPLRERKEDIPLLAQAFLKKNAPTTGNPILGLTKLAMAKLMRLQWPGNIRELENAVERAIVFCDKSMIDENDIVVQDQSVQGAKLSELLAEVMTLKDMEKAYIEYALVRTNERKDKAAELLGIDRKTLYLKVKKYGIKARMDLAGVEGFRPGIS